MDLKNYLADKVCRSEDRREIKIMSMLDGEWAKAVGAEFKKPYYRDLYNFVRDEYATHVVYPPADDIFNAMHFTPLDKVKVLILGQDPYHNVNQAHGLSFQCFRLRRIFHHHCRISTRNCTTI